MSNTNSRVLTLDTALYQVGVARRQILEFLEAVRPSIEHRAFHAARIPGSAWPWTMEQVLSLAYVIAGWDYWKRDELGTPVAWDTPLEFFVQDTTGAPFHRVFYDSWTGLRNNLQAYCLGQSKRRAKGVWIGHTEENRMRIRIPHR